MKTYNNHKGGALVTVLMLIMAASLMAGALLAYTMAERRLNRRAYLILQARDAAHAALEYGASQIQVAVTSLPTLPQSYLLQSVNGKYPLHLYLDPTNGCPALYTAGTTAQNQNNYVITTSINLYGSQLTSTGSQFINPNDPINKNDQDIYDSPPTQALWLMAKATATDTDGNSETDYAMDAIRLRVNPPGGMCSNGPLELGAGGDISYDGPVFCNSNIYLSTGGIMAFSNTFMSAGQIIAAPLDLGSGESGRPTGQAIEFSPDGGTTYVSIQNPTIGGVSLGTWVDSLLNTTNPTSANQSGSLPTETFAEASTALWGTGMVEDASMGVQKENLPGVPAGATHGIIEPADPSLSTNSSAANFSAAEAEKFSEKAGLYIVVEPNLDSNPTGVSVVAFTNPVDAESYEYSGAGGTKGNVSARTAWLTANPGKVLVFTANGHTGTKSGSTANSLGTGIVNTNHLFNDPRESASGAMGGVNAPLNAVDIDMGALATAIGTNTGTITNVTLNGTPWYANNTVGQTGGWNGIVYLDVETDVGATPSTAAPSGWTQTSDVPSSDGSGAITATGGATAVRLFDGETLPSLGMAPGCTVSTNAPVYIVGNYNSDGTLPGGNNPTVAQVDTPDSVANNYPAGNTTETEVPAMVACDSIDVLSASYWETPGKYNGITYPAGEGYFVGDGTITTHNGLYDSEPTAASTEIATAVMSGNVPTTTSGAYQYSGGFENYFRLIENWGGDNLRFRGPMISFYSSTVAKAYWPGTGNKTYQIPNRQWGYDTIFNSSNYPGYAGFPTVRRLNYTELSLAQFNTYIADAKNFYKWQLQ